MLFYSNDIMQNACVVIFPGEITPRLSFRGKKYPGVIFMMERKNYPSGIQHPCGALFTGDSRNRGLVGVIDPGLRNGPTLLCMFKLSMYINPCVSG